MSSARTVKKQIQATAKAAIHAGTTTASTDLIKDRRIQELQRNLREADDFMDDQERIVLRLQIKSHALQQRHAATLESVTSRVAAASVVWSGIGAVVGAVIAYSLGL